jgi:hypothetical protein
VKKFNQIKALVSQIEADAHKFYEKGNSAAGTRLRKGLLTLKLLSTEVRKDVTARKHVK